VPRERHVHAPRLERRRRRAALRDDRIAQPVEVGPVFHEVVGVLQVLDELALAPVLDLERSRAHAAGAVAGRRHMRGVDRRESGGQHQQEGWLWVLQSEHDRLRVERVDRLHLAVPVAPRAETPLGPPIRRLPPDWRRWPWEATPVTNTSPARPITERNRVIPITHLRFQSLSILVGRQSARAISDAPLKRSTAPTICATFAGATRMCTRSPV